MEQKKKKILIICAVAILVIGLLAIIIGIINSNSKPKIYTVTFDTNGGTNIQFINVNEGENITLPKETPTKEGYVFEKWMLEEKVISEDYQVKKDITLKASWIKENIAMMIHFDSDGGNSIPSIVLEEGTKITLPKMPMKKGYHFLGWYLGEEKIENGRVFEGATVLTLKAKWEKVPLSKNKNILEAYTYDNSSCITGKEENCVKLLSLPSIVEPGTIIKYKVNDQEEKYFHVMFDNGNTLTMQQQENTVNQVAWYNNFQETASQTTSDKKTTTAPKVIQLKTMFLAGSYFGDNTKGPLTVLPALESATASWTNVKNQTYTMGSTVLKSNAYTTCDDELACFTNGYTLPERSARARMITVQEARILGCKNSPSNFCPVWMKNYLRDSINQGGTNDGRDNGYWTMSSAYTPHPNREAAFSIISKGSLQRQYAYNTFFGARAVVVIDK